MLTASLPGCHLKTTHESAKFETLTPFFLFFFELTCERIFIKMNSIESNVIGPGNIVSAGMSMHLSAQKFYGLGQ